MTKDYAIIVAGGKGLRMGGEVPKQFLPIAGMPVLMRTLRRFWEYAADLQIILVLPKEQQDYWRSLCAQYHFPLPQSKEAGGELYLLADGGATRFHSVQNGLALIPDDTQGVVGIHDGVRPFVAVEVIRRCYEEARRHKAVIPVIPVVETLRHIQGEATIQNSKFKIQYSQTVPRSDYRLVQTPQCFDIQLLKAAYKRAKNQICLDSAEHEQARPEVKAANHQPYTEAFTDDASVVEAYGAEVFLVDGNRENIKITTPFDLAVAESLIEAK